MAPGPIAVALLESAADDALVLVLANLVLAHELARRVPEVAVLSPAPHHDDSVLRLSWTDTGAASDTVVLGIEPLRAVCAIARPLTPDGLRTASWELRARGELPPPAESYAAVLLRDPAGLDDATRRRLDGAQRVVGWSPQDLGRDDALELRKDVSATELLVLVEAASLVVTDEPAIAVAACAYGREVELVGDPASLAQLPVRVDGRRVVCDELAWADACDDLDDAFDRAAVTVRSRAGSDAGSVVRDDVDAYVQNLETAVRAQTARLDEQRTVFGEHLAFLEREQAEQRAELQQALDESRAESAERQAEIERLHATKIFRYTRWLRARYERTRTPPA